MLSDIAHELNDQGGRSTLTRILRLYWQSRLTPEQFIELIYAVRFKVRGLPDNRFRRRGPNGKANRMPMFLMLIEKVMIHGLGVLEQQKPASKTEQLPVPEQSSTEQDPVANPQADEHSLPAPEHVAAEDTNSCGDRLLHTQNSTPPSTERLAIQPMCTDAESDAAHIQIPPPSMQRLATQPVCTDAEGNVAPIQALPPSMKRSMSPEALRHQRTMQALKDVRHLVDEPLRIAPEGQACRDCGGIVKYSMHKCVICQPAKTWSMYDHKRICKALAKADAGSA
ncbi:MAG: hypothetical protein E6J34_17725 [Chloroflexi bacterium]|nr:MAG: hypothetical protein E6J34_17725 [Chloroflexota bacterium]